MMKEKEHIELYNVLEQTKVAIASGDISIMMDLLRAIYSRCMDETDLCAEYLILEEMHRQYQEKKMDISEKDRIDFREAYEAIGNEDIDEDIDISEKDRIDFSKEAYEAIGNEDINLIEELLEKIYSKSAIASLTQEEVYVEQILEHTLNETELG